MWFPNAEVTINPALLVFLGIIVGTLGGFFGVGGGFLITGGCWYSEFHRCSPLAPASPW